MLEGSQLCGKETSSPKPKSGERWTLVGKWTLVPEDRETQGAPPPSSVLSADVCLSMCFSMPITVCITAGIVSCLIVLWCVVSVLLPIKPWSLISVSESFSEQADSCWGN